MVGARKKTQSGRTAPVSDQHSVSASRQSKERRGIQSADKAVEVLRRLLTQAKPAPLRDLARAINMPTSLVHRYLASLMASGLAEVYRCIGTRYRATSHSLFFWIATRSIVALGIDIPGLVVDRVENRFEDAVLFGKRHPRRRNAHRPRLRLLPMIHVCLR